MPILTENREILYNNFSAMYYTLRSTHMTIMIFASRVVNMPRLQLHVTSEKNRKSMKLSLRMPKSSAGVVSKNRFATALLWTLDPLRIRINFDHETANKIHNRNRRNYYKLSQKHAMIWSRIEKSLIPNSRS